MIGFGSLIALLGVVGLAIAGWVSAWYLAVPLATAVIGKELFEYSWVLALRKGWEYDGERASWLEGGARRTYRFDHDSRSTP